MLLFFLLVFWLHHHVPDDWSGGVGVSGRAHLQVGAHSRQVWGRQWRGRGRGGSDIDCAHVCVDLGIAMQTYILLSFESRPFYSYVYTRS